MHPLRDRKAVVRSRSRSTLLLTIYFLVALIIPNCVLANTEHYSVWTVEALILMPLGFYMMWSVLLRRSGIMIWLGFPFIFFGAFQLALLYLFGNSIIATDMFTNVLTTNPGEAGELLGNISPAVIVICVIYVPLLWFASREIGPRRCISRTARMNLGFLGAILFSLGWLSLWPAWRTTGDRHILRDKIFPINVMYNVRLCAAEFRRMQHFEESAAGFTFGARRTAEAGGREIYVYVIGEAARAMNWQLYGYGRETNPELSRVEDLVVFRNILTQSNTTHKSVPLLLSSVGTGEHDELYRRRGLPHLFNEAGFETWFISNQSPQGAMIDKLAADAAHVRYIRSPRYDMQLLDEMRRAVESSRAPRICFILHCYGSHFSYHQRYPREFARFLPDDDVAIAAKHRDKLLNAYDNSVLYTDHFLARTIEYLRGMSDTRSALLYCADHGEDLIDDERERFLHASPTTTAWQLHVAGVFGCLPPRIPGQGGGGAAQRRGARDHPRDVPHDGRHRLDKGRRVSSHLGVARERRFRPYGAPLLPQRPQRSGALRGDGPDAGGCGAAAQVGRRNLSRSAAVRIRKKLHACSLGFPVFEEIISWLPPRPCGNPSSVSKSPTQPCVRAFRRPCCLFLPVPVHSQRTTRTEP